MTSTTTPDYRLSSYDADRLADAAGRLNHFSPECVGVKRVEFYLRRGYGLADALAYALAYLRNVNEQYERNLAHDTGAVGWR